MRMQRNEESEQTACDGYNQSSRQNGPEGGLSFQSPTFMLMASRSRGQDRFARVCGKLSERGAKSGNGHSCLLDPNPLLLGVRCLSCEGLLRFTKPGD